MFSGYGGFAIAGERYGIETIGFPEIDKYASMVLKYRFPEVVNYGDCGRIDWRSVPDFDLLNKRNRKYPLTTNGNERIMLIKVGEVSEKYDDKGHDKQDFSPWFAERGHCRQG